MLTIGRAGTFLLLALCGATSIARAQGTCVTPFVAVGPVDPVNGFPAYYIDANNVALQPCLDTICNPALALPNPGKPVHFPDNFPDEFFYWSAVSDVISGTVRARVVLGLTGAFLNGSVVPGEQVVFSRVRVRVSNLVPGATYRVTHPFGQLNLQAGPLGTINVTEDIGNLSPGQFQLAQQGNVGPFLTFVSGLIPPAPGTIGTTLADQTLTGSRCGQNFFRIEGPGLPGGNVGSNLFGTLIGKIAPICGNGVLDVTEQCDDGNTLDGDCCSSTCKIDPAGTACSDGSVCTAGDKCTGGTPTCVGTAINCNDGNVCTTDSCDPTLGCQHTNNTIPCNDGNTCTGGDACSNGACSGTTATADGVPCSDGSVCTTGDACSGGVCTPGATIDCSDGNVCTDDSCNPITGCAHTPNTVACDDGDPVTKFDACTAGSCMGVSLLAPLSLRSGENPSVSPAFPASGDARLRGTIVQLTLGNLDPLRFPAGSSCQTTVSAGSASGSGTMARGVAPGSSPSRSVTVFTFQANGTARAGDTASVRIRCTLGGVRHETQWQGVFGAP